jgi:hypothetical protein
MLDALLRTRVRLRLWVCVYRRAPRVRSVCARTQSGRERTPVNVRIRAYTCGCAYRSAIRTRILVGVRIGHRAPRVRSVCVRACAPELHVPNHIRPCRMQLTSPDRAPVLCLARAGVPRACARAPLCARPPVCMPPQRWSVRTVTNTPPCVGACYCVHTRELYRVYCPV